MGNEQDRDSQTQADIKAELERNAELAAGIAKSLSGMTQKR